MSGEKTELPTPKRLREAREKGQVPSSKDLTSAALLVVSVAVLSVFGGWTAVNLAQIMHRNIARAAAFKGDLDLSTSLGMLLEGVKAMAITLTPLFIALFIIAYGVSYIQIGSIFAAEKIKPDIKKINPVEGFKQKFFKSRSYIELLKTIVKMAITVAVIWNLFRATATDLLRLIDQSIIHIAAFTADFVFKMGVRVGLAFIALGAADFFLQKYLHINDLKMSKQEIIDEYKKTEGDPHIKHQRKYLHRQLLNEAPAASVKKASAVVTNPTHLAVAIQYDSTTMSAPIVVAKGAELMAAHIRGIALEANVPIIQDKPLARALYELEIEEEIPEDLYEAVAIVLRWALKISTEH